MQKQNINIEIAEKKVEVRTGKIIHAGYSHEYWAESGRYNVMAGALFIPFWPVEPPILNTSTITMKWLIKPGLGETTTYKIQKESFLLTDDKGKPHFPFGIQASRFTEPDVIESKEYYDTRKLTDGIEVTGNTLFEFTLNTAIYSELEWFEMQPVISQGEENHCS